MQRILIIGSSGSGKSVLAARLGEVLDLPVVHLDRLFWKPGWVESSRAEMDQKVAAACEQHRWIIDGNYGRSLQARLEACDGVIFLDFPRWACLLGAVRRYFQYRGKTRPDMGEGCSERLTWEFVKWVWGFPQRGRPEVLERLEAVRDRKEIVVLRSRREVEAFLAEQARSASRSTTPADAG